MMVLPWGFSGPTFYSLGRLCLLNPKSLKPCWWALDSPWASASFAQVEEVAWPPYTGAWFWLAHLALTHSCTDSRHKASMSRVLPGSVQLLNNTMLQVFHFIVLPEQISSTALSYTDGDECSRRALVEIRHWEGIADLRRKWMSSDGNESSHTCNKYSSLWWRESGACLHLGTRASALTTVYWCLLPYLEQWTSWAGSSLPWKWERGPPGVLVKWG